MRKILFLASLFLMLAGGVSAREFHVAKSGSDTNDGSAAAPFLTINRAVMVLRAGDTVTVHAGVYREWVRPRNSGADLDQHGHLLAVSGRALQRGDDGAF